MKHHSESRVGMGNGWRLENVNSFAMCISNIRASHSDIAEKTKKKHLRHRSSLAIIDFREIVCAPTPARIRRSLQNFHILSPVPNIKSVTSSTI